MSAKNTIPVNNELGLEIDSHTFMVRFLEVNDV